MLTSSSMSLCTRALPTLRLAQVYVVLKHSSDLLFLSACELCECGARYKPSCHKPTTVTATRRDSASAVVDLDQPVMSDIRVINVSRA
jgi:hypothetical protein